MILQQILKMKKKEELNITNELIEAVKSQKTFSEIGINEQLVKAVTELGYTHATEIQERSIPNVHCPVGCPVSYLPARLSSDFLCQVRWAAAREYVVWSSASQGYDFA